MAGTFEETQDIMPRGIFIIMAAVLAATDIFILVCSFIESVGTPLWMFIATSAIFAAILAFLFLVKLKVSVEGDVISVRFLRQYVIPFGEIIDSRVGDIEMIRSYSGWGIKKVTFKNLICIGYDRGISLKLTGRRVMTVSLSDPEGFAALLPPPQS